MSPLWQLTLSRLRIFFREPSAVFWTFGFPIVLSIALGVAFRNRPPEPLPVAVVSGPGSAWAMAALSAAHELTPRELTAAQAREALRTGKAALVVEPAAAPGAPPTYWADPTRPESLLSRSRVDDALQTAAGRRPVFAARDHLVTESGARYIDFLIPGLLGMNLMSSGMWGIGYLIVDMRTRKLLKRMMATPMRRSHFLLSFVFMRMLFVLLELPVLLLFGYVAFGVKTAGSLPLLCAVACVGALSFAGVGLLVASRAQNNQSVSGLINLVMMPMWIGSGVFFSTSRFPDFLQPVLRILPLTALNDALRAVMLEGASPLQVAPRVGLLLAIGGICFLISLKIFRWR